MKRLLLRGLPWIVAIFGGTLGYLQFTFPLTYPWPLVIFLLMFIGAVGCYVALHKSMMMQTIRQGIPSVLFLLGLGVTFLLVESTFAEWVIIVLCFLIPLLILELLYLALFETFRYPVNAISRLNVAFVPAIAFLFGVSGNGLYIFLRLSPWFSLLIFPAVIAALYDVTAHPTADTYHRLRWDVLGAVLGLQAAVLVLLLPVPLIAHGAIAALIVSAPLRIRRYAYAPTPSRRHAWFEGSAALAFFLTILLISPWA